MSKTVDERIVSMQFDNKHFESNVQTTLGTLDKLKQKLNLQGASKGLENINTAASNVNMSGLSNSVETVRSRFSALEVMGVTALANITNSAVNAGKRIVSALTIDPVKTGFNEYELKMDSVKTILASTKDAGETIESVNKYLNELNKYSDQTIYSFSDMTQNIGKFTNAGVKLEDAVMAIKGISNEAAVSGANANEASRAMYNFAQALSSGYVKLIDWKSIENANMATVEFKQQLIDTAVSLGTVTKESDGMYKTLKGNTFNATQNFNDVLQDQWMTSEALIGTLKNYADETTDIGKKAKAAAQEVTKFSQIFDIAKETAQSGWAQTWETLFGNIDQAKALFTPISEGLNAIIDKFSDVRNAILKKALDSPFVKLAEKISNVTGATKEMTAATEDFSQVVKDVINGKWGNGQARWDALAKAGYDWAHIQNLVNEELGCSVRHATDYGKAQSKTNEVQKKTISQLVEMTDAQLEAAGWTKEEIKLLRQLEEQSKNTGIPLEDLIKDLDQLSGRNLLINSFKNMWASLVGVFNSVKKAWQEVFPPKSIDERAQKLYGIIQAFHKFSMGIKTWISDADNADKVTRTFKGLFAALDMIFTLVGGPLKIAFKVFKKILEAFDLDIWDVTAAIGDAIVKVHDWIDAHLDIEKIFKNLINLFNSAKEGIKNWIKGLQETDDVPKYIMDSLVKGFSAIFSYLGSKFSEYGSKVYEKIKTLLLSIGIDISGIGKTISGALNNIGIDPSGFVNTIKTWVESFKSWIEELKKSDNIPRDIILGLVSGLSSGISTVVAKVIEIGTKIIDTICAVLGIQSPSKEMKEVGKFTIQGLIDGILEMLGILWDIVTSIGTKILEIIRGFDLGQTVAALISGGLVYGFVKLVNIVDNLTSPLGELGDLMEQVKDTIKGVGKSLSMSLKASAIKNIAIALAILVGSVIALTLVDHTKLLASIGTILALAVILGGLSAAISKFGTGDSKDMAKVLLSIMSLSAVFLAMALVVKILGSMELDTLIKGGAAIVILSGIIVGLIAATKLVGKLISQNKAFDDLANMIKKIGVALLLMSAVIFILGMMSTETLVKGGVAILALSGIIVGLIAATKLASDKQLNHMKRTLQGIAIVFLAMGIIVQLLGGMKTGALSRGIIAVALLGGMIVGLIAATKLAGGKRTNQIGNVLLGTAAAILAMGLMVQLLGGMDVATLTKGTIAVTVLAAIVSGLVILVSRCGGEKKVELAARTILAAAAAIAVLGALSIILGFFDVAHLAKGVGAVLFLTAGLALVIDRLGKIGEVKMGPLLMLTFIIALLAGAVITLSFLDPVKVAASAASLSLILGIFALLVQSTNGMKNIPIAPLLTISGVVVIIAGVLGVLSALNVEPSVKSAIAISILLVTMTGVMAALSLIGPMASGAIAAATSLVAVVAIIGAFVLALGALNQIEGLQGLIESGGNLLQAIGTAIGQFIGGLVGGLAQGITASLPQIGLDLSMFMTNVTPFIVGAKMVDEKVLAGIGILAGAIIALTAADLLEGIASFLTGGSSFADLGTQLSQFITNAMPFIQSSSLITEETMKGVKMLADVILTLTTANVIDGLTSWLTGGNALDKFASQLPSLGTGLRGFLDSLGGMGSGDLDAVNSAAQAVKTLAAASAEIPNTGGLLGALVGENDLGTFADQFPKLGTGISEFLKNLGDFSSEKLPIVEAAANAVKTLASASQEVPNSGGWLGAIVGENDLGTFADQFPKLGTGISEFLKNIGDFSSEKLPVIEAAANAVKTLASASKEIPNSGGLLGMLVGENDLGTFADQFPNVGKGIRGLIDELGTFTPEEQQSVTIAAMAVAALAKAAQDVPDSGGILSAFIGSADLSGFAEKMPELGKGVKGFSDAVAGIDPEATLAGSQAVAFMANMATTINGVDIGKIPTFGENIGQFGVYLAAFFKATSEITQTRITIIDKATDSFANMSSTVDGVKLITVAKGINDLTSAMSKMSSIDSASATGLTASLNALAEVNLEALTTKFEEIDEKMRNAGKAAIDCFYSGMYSNRTSVENKIKNHIVDKFVSAMSSANSQFKEAGKACVEGFGTGITENTFHAEAKAQAMAEAALEAAKEALDSHSPSREFMKIGTYVPEGFAKGIDKFSGMVSNSSENMANTAIKTVSRSITDIANAVNADIDTQPTIRPVLDLSDVQSGANRIGSMFGDRSMSFNAAGSISASMSGYQNGKNSDELLTAVRGLRKDIANMPRNTYNVNGVTYDDGSNVTEAVGSLIRAIELERRR